MPLHTAYRHQYFPPPPSPKHNIIPPPTPTPPIFPLHIHSQTPSFSTKSNNPLPRPYQSPISDSISSPSPDLLSSPNSKHTLSSPLHSLALFLFLHSYPHHHAPHQLPSYHPTSARRSPALAHTPNLSCTSTAASNLTLPGFPTSSPYFSVRKSCEKGGLADMWVGRYKEKVRASD